VVFAGDGLLAVVGRGGFSCSKLDVEAAQGLVRPFTSLNFNRRNVVGAPMPEERRPKRITEGVSIFPSFLEASAPDVADLLVSWAL